jgi:hypothetical protein
VRVRVQVQARVVQVQVLVQVQVRVRVVQVRVQVRVACQVLVDLPVLKDRVLHAQSIDTKVNVNTVAAYEAAIVPAHTRSSPKAMPQEVAMEDEHEAGEAASPEGSP